METVAYISSLVDPPPELMLKIIRSHWTIENSLFNIRDVTYQEDRQTMHKRSGALNMAAIRSLAIGLAKILAFPAVPDAIQLFRAMAKNILKYFKFNYRLEAI